MANRGIESNRHLSSLAVLLAFTLTHVCASLGGDLRFFHDRLPIAVACGALTGVPFVFTYVSSSFRLSWFLHYTGKVVAIIAMFYVVAAAATLVIQHDQTLCFRLLKFSTGAMIAGSVCSILWGALALLKC